MYDVCYNVFILIRGEYMSIINKAIASTGFSGIKVNIYLDDQKVCKGCQVNGFLSISGGKFEQKASRVTLSLKTIIDINEDNSESEKYIEILKADIAKNITIKSEDGITIPFSFVLPYDTPVSFNNNTIWLEAGMDIKVQSEKSYIKVIPHPFMQRILEVLQTELKFILTKNENIYVPNNGSHLPIVQVFEFNATSRVTENLDEVKMMFFVDDLRGLEIVVELPGRINCSQEQTHKFTTKAENVIQIFIPKNEFDKDNKYLADLFLRSIQKCLA